MWLSLDVCEPQIESYSQPEIPNLSLYLQTFTCIFTETSKQMAAHYILMHDLI